MNATATATVNTSAASNYDEAADYIWNNSFDKPTLVVSRARVGVQYDALQAGLGDARIHYAAKAISTPRLMVLPKEIFAGSAPWDRHSSIS